MSFKHIIKSKASAIRHYLIAQKYCAMPNMMDENIVLMPFFGRLGDVVMFLDMLEEWKRLIVTEKGKKLIFACRFEVWNLLEIIGCTHDLLFMELSRDDLEASLTYFEQKIIEARGYHPGELINVRENSVIENAFIYAVPAKRKIIYRSFDMIYQNPIARFFSLKAYSESWKPEKEMDQISCYADMIRKYGNSAYQSKLYIFPEIKEKEFFPKKSYLCVCPGASAANKCWPKVRYARMTDYIIEKTGLDVIFLGGKNDMGMVVEIISLMNHRDKVVDLAGRTSLAGWVSVIQNSKFVLTNESGSVHIAAASRIPSVCIGEQKFSDKWLPYRPEMVRDEDCLPVVVRSEKLDCSFCARRGFKWSAACKACYKKNGVVKCIYEVDEKAVKEAIDKVLRDYNI